MKKNAQQRQKIISASRQLFAQHGYAKTSIRQIKEQAGIAEGLLYYYFPKGKHELLDVIVHEGVNDRMQVAYELLDSWDDTVSEGQVLALFDGITTMVQDTAEYQAFLITVRERASLSDDQSAWLIQSFDGVQTHLQTALLKLQSSQPVATIQALAQTIMSIFVKTLFDELLLRNHRYLSATARVHVAQQIQLVLQLLQ